MEQLIAYLSNYPTILLILGGIGTLVVAATAYVAATPSKTDDEKLEQLKKNALVAGLIKFFEAFSVVQRKEKEVTKDPSSKSDAA